MADKLTPKQEMFIKEYLVDLNATQAAIRAGYSAKMARQMGAENLSKPYIAAEIQKAMDERSERVGIKADDVLREIASIAYDDISNYLDFYPGKNGEIKVDIKDSRTINTRNISEINIGKDGQFKFKLYCRDEALNSLGRHLKLFTENHNVNLEAGVKIINDIPRTKTN